MSIEYERRFLLESLPPFDPVYEKQIRQVYWSLGNDWYLRLRRQGTGFAHDDVITLKGPRFGSERPEFEWNLDSTDKSESGRDAALDAALNLYRAGSANQVVKRRIGYDIDGLLWDVDVFQHANEGLIIAEIEMKSQNAVLAVSKPYWALIEVTTDRRYNNENLAFRSFSTWRD